jgi:hypothetical protein
MPVYVAVVRIAQCCICTQQWGLAAGEPYPDACKVCGSTEWMWGPESKDTRLIRQGISRLRRRLNPGVASKKRQDRAKAQWQGFKPKPEVQDASEKAD